MSTKHTGEAWVSSFAAGENGPALFTTVEGKNVRLANFVETTEADRRLAAASPDLLAACKAAENWLSEYEDGPDSGVAGLLAQLRNAIKGAGV